MANKPIKEISKRKYIVFLGVFLCLLSLILFLNAGFVSKGLSFSFTYVLGFSSYILYGLLFAEGVFLIAKNKGISLLANKYFWFAVVFVVGLSGFITYLLVDQKELILSFIPSRSSVAIKT